MPLNRPTLCMNCVSVLWDRVRLSPIAGMGPELQDPYSTHRNSSVRKVEPRAVHYSGVTHVYSHEDAGGLVQEVLLLLGGASAAHAALDDV